MKHNTCPAGQNVACCNHDCLQGRACAERVARVLRDPPSTVTPRTAWALCLLACMGLWSAVIFLPPWSEWWATAVAIVGTYGWVLVGALVGLLALGMAAHAVIAGALDRYLPPAEAGDTHAGLPPITRTADARVIERQATAALQHAAQQARTRERLNARLHRAGQLPPSYPPQEGARWPRG